MSNRFVFTNFMVGELLDNILAATTELRIAPSVAAQLQLFNPGDNLEARLTLWDGQEDPEIVGCIGNPQTGVLTVNRAQENTTARAWSAGTQVRCVLTAAVINQALLASVDVQELLQQQYLPLAGGTVTGPILLPDQDPTDANEAARKSYVDNVQGNKLPLAGGTMLGSINMNSNRLLSLPAPVATSEPARKAETDDIIADQAAINADRSGVLVSGGTSTAYTVASNTGYTSLVDGIVIAFRPHATNGLDAELTLDTTPSTPIHIIPGTAAAIGAIRQDVPVSFIYSSAYDAWLLLGATNAASAWYAGDTKWSEIQTDHDMWLLEDGRSLLRTTHAALFAVIGTRYGAVDGTHFNINNMAGRSRVARDNISGASANISQVTTNITTINGSATATVASASRLAVGMYVNASSVPSGVTITDISGTTVTLSDLATASTTVSGRFSFLLDANTTGSTGGAITSILTTYGMPSHSHTATVSGGTIGSGSTTSTNTPGAQNIPATPAGISVAISSTGGSGYHGNFSPASVSNPFVYSPH